MCKAIYNFNLSENGYNRITAITCLICSILTFNTYYLNGIESGVAIYGGLFHVTNISQTLEIFLFVVSSIILIAWPLDKLLINKISLSNEKIENIKEIINIKNFNSYRTNYSLIVLFNLFGASLLLTSYDLISLYLCIELQSFSLYVLSTLYRNSELSTSAGLKYFLLGSLSSCFILFGCAVIYSVTGLTQFDSIFILLSSSDLSSYFIGFFFGLILIFVGLLFKISAAPLHNWSPDVYQDTPTIVTIWLTIIPKIAILILLLELFSGISSFFINFNWNFLNFEEEAFNYYNELLILFNYYTNIKINFLIKNLLLISSLLSLFIGSIVGLAQIKLKRLLAYSTISHIGFILLALAINSQQSIDSFIFYIFQYTITNLNIFLIVISISYIISNIIIFSKSNDLSNLNFFFNSKSDSKINLNSELNPENEFESKNRNISVIKDINYISELKNLFFTNPLIAICFSICLFSMAGIPPLIGFFAKFFVLYSALQSGYNFITFICILVSVISASYYLKIIKVIFTRSNYDFSQYNNTILFKNYKIINKNFEVIVLSNIHSYLISALTLINLFFILKPSLILNSTQLLSLNFLLN
jgi:NADH-ubiquinone oxidoreductase chain 2